MLNIHSRYSLKYGILSPGEIISWARENNYPTIAITDINTTTAILQSCIDSQQVKYPIAAGVDIRNNLEQKYIIIAKNNRGFHELNTFLSHYLHQQKEFPQQPPHLGNCYIVYPWKNVPKSLHENEFLGIQSHELNRFKIHPPTLPKNKLIALQSMTFRNKRDYNTHRLLRSIHQNCLLSKLEESQTGRIDQLFKSFADFKHDFREHPELILQAKNMLSDCRISFQFGEEAPPQNLKTYTGSKEEDLALLTELSYKGLSYRYPNSTTIIEERIQKEIQIIAQKDYLSYFLITWDFTQYARSKGYFYVGRGSGANSLVAYLLRITDVDPLELDLYFERFINLYRKNPPDFDIDFSWKDREDVTQYIFNRYPNTALLCTYNTFQYRATVRELGKVFGLPKTEIDRLSSGKFIVQQLDELSVLVLKYAKQIEGLPSHLSVHAGGIVISEKPITWYSATFLPPKGYSTTQFSMLEAEDVGLYKFDVLSQRGLAKIHDCLTIVEQNQPDRPAHDIHDLRHFKQDEKIKTLLREAQALGCFYVESPAMRMLLQKLKVDDYLTLVAASSIIRPGVSHSGMMREYILRHKYPEKRKDAHPVMLSIMPDTYGVMVYQEDVIKVAHHFAGLDLGQADVLRRGMSGKFRSRAEFQKVEETYFENCKKKGYTEELSREIWRQIESFAGYAFSKGHSASYAVESYQSLYLKAYYPLEYMVATINNFGGYYRTEVYVHEARMLGGSIEAPSINEGDYETLILNQRIILGFNLVLGIESALLHKVFNERKRGGAFIHFEDLLNRTAIPLEQLLLIIRIGALRDLPEERRNMLWKAHLFHNKVHDKNPQPVLFAPLRKNFKLPQFIDDPLELAFEQMELLGFPLCNPFDLTEESTSNGVLAKDIPSLLHQKVVCYGYLIALKQSKTIKNELMYFGNFIDTTGQVFDSVHFPEVARRFPYKGKGIYKIQGIITEEFGHFAIVAEHLSKINFVNDVRYVE
ncbi:MAG: DNA polymerase III subunit alpha [Bacteroidetes bacterium]|nr:DNA polymerase III subunit alpha [Bacteroidota bacterium]